MPPLRLSAPVRCACALLAALAGCASTTPVSAPPLRVMSFNVRLMTDADGPDRWQARRELAVRVIADADPDLIGTQELHRPQGADIVARLPRYAWFGRDRRGGRADEHMGVFYRVDRLRVLESGDFWLSDTPDVPGSVSWGHPFPRMVTWALFERRADRRRFYLFNTHLPYREQDEDARVRGARLLLARIAALPDDVPVVVTGDFNAAPASPTHAELASLLGDAHTLAAQREGPEATFHGFKGMPLTGMPLTGMPSKAMPMQRIDWILVRGFDVRRLRTIDTHAGGRYPSDHFPLLAELEWR